MTALWIILAIALALTVLNLLPVGVDAALRRTMCFRSRRASARSGSDSCRNRRMQSQRRKSPQNRRRKSRRRQSAPPDIRTILALAKLGLQALDRFRQRLRVQLLRLVFVSGAPDPYDTALAFGYVNAALGALTPLAERALRIDERDIQTGVDFQAERPRIDARIVCTIRIGQIVVIALAFGAGFLKQKMHAKQARAARAKTAPATQERKVSNG